MSDQTPERVDLTAPGDVRPPVHAELLDDPWFPFTGDVRVKALEARVDAEPLRGDLAGDCRQCARPDDSFVWTNANWRLHGVKESAIPGIVLLETRDHYDSYADMPEHLLRDMGPLAARIERALLSLGDVARVHICRWGDGGEHFHLWFMPRPAGALQLRGSMLPMWLDVMPGLPSEVVEAALERIAAALRDV